MVKFDGYFFFHFRLTIDLNIKKYQQIWWLELLGNDILQKASVNPIKVMRRQQCLSFSFGQY